MRTVKEIRKELEFAKDNGLTADQIEALEMEMWDAETAECEAFVVAKQIKEDEKELVRKVFSTYKKVTIRIESKMQQFARWFIQLDKETRNFILENALSVWKKHTRNKFKVLANMGKNN